jgi:hypothetical protein
MSKSITTDNDLVNYTFTNAAISWRSNTTLYIALHTASPLTTGDQTTNEATYIGYARFAVNRDALSWNVNLGTASNLVDIVFPQSQGTNNTVTYVSIGVASSGASQILYFGALTAGGGLITNGITPQILFGNLIVAEA